MTPTVDHLGPTVEFTLVTPDLCPCGCGLPYATARADGIQRGIPEDRVDAWLEALAGVVVPDPARG